MTKELDATGLIAFLLWRKRGKNVEVTFEELRNLKFKIEKNFPKYYIPIDCDAVFDITIAHPELFEWDQNRVIRAEGSERYFHKIYMNYALEIYLPKDVLAFMRKECVPKSAAKQTKSAGKDGLSNIEK